MNWIKKKSIKIASLIAIIAITILIIELLSRIFYDQLSTPSSRLITSIAQQDSFLAYDQSPIKARFQPHPYMLYQLTPNYEGDFKTNSLGYRNKEIRLEKESQKVRILTLGGSTTYGAIVHKQEDTWPSQLEAILNLKADKYEVINGGVDSASSAEILSSWIYKNRFLKPDIVILNLGINDIWPILLTKNYSSDYSYFRAAQSYVRASRLSKVLLKLSFFYRIVWGHLNSSKLNGNDAGYPYVQALDSDLQESEIKNGAVTRRVINTYNKGFADNFEMLIRLLRLDGVKVFVVLEPSLSEREFIQKTSKQDPYFITGIEKPWLIVKEKNEKIMTEVAKKYHVQYLKIDNALFKSEWYGDWYHLYEDGEKMKAKIIGNALKKQILVD